MRKENFKKIELWILLLLIFLLCFLLIKPLTSITIAYKFKPQIHEEYRVSIVDKEVNWGLTTYKTYNGYLVEYVKYKNGNVKVTYRYFDNVGEEYTATITAKDGDKVYFILENNTNYEIGD